MNVSSPEFNDWTVEAALPEDTEKIARMHSESFKKAYLKEDDEDHNKQVIDEATQFLTPERMQLRSELLAHSLEHSDKHFYQVALHDDGEVIGLIYGTKREAVQEIEALYVDEAYFGAGVGRALVESYIDWADSDKPIELGVYKENERAKRFYRKMGFEALNDDRQSFYPFMPETTMKRKADNEQQ